MSANRVHDRMVRTASLKIRGSGGTTVVLEEAAQSLLVEDRRQHVVYLHRFRLTLTGPRMVSSGSPVARILNALATGVDMSVGEGSAQQGWTGRSEENPRPAPSVVSAPGTGLTGPRCYRPGSPVSLDYIEGDAQARRGKSKSSKIFRREEESAGHTLAS